MRSSNTALLLAASVSFGVFACGNAAPSDGASSAAVESNTSGTAVAGSSADAGADATAPSLFTWPVPKGGAPETIAFPLPFAPEIPYEGTLELRFLPHFFDPTAETYFSYSFVWILDRPEFWNPSLIEQNLTDYYSGLAKSSDPEHFNPTVHHAHLELADGFRGILVDTQDGFNEGVPLRLNVAVDLISCPVTRKSGLIFSLSPRPFRDAVWVKLDTSRAAFACR